MVLTLRKKYSVVRDRARSQHIDEPATNAPPGSSTAAPPAPAEAGERVEPSDRSVLDRNPWEEDPPAAQPRTQRPRAAGQLYRRLSFDAASGVIALPEDGTWLGQEDSDSDDYGDMQNSTMMDSQAGEGAEQGYGATSSGPSGSPNSNKRYSTYYHHPERRKTYTQGPS